MTIYEQRNGYVKWSQRENWVCLDQEGPYYFAMLDGIDAQCFIALAKELPHPLSKAMQIVALDYAEAC